MNYITANGDPIALPDLPGASVVVVTDKLTTIGYSAEQMKKYAMSYALLVLASVTKAERKVF